jgi:hypothetical protein
MRECARAEFCTSQDSFRKVATIENTSDKISRRTIDRRFLWMNPKAKDPTPRDTPAIFID